MYKSTPFYNPYLLFFLDCVVKHAFITFVVPFSLFLDPGFPGNPQKKGGGGEGIAQWRAAQGQRRGRIIYVVPHRK